MRAYLTAYAGKQHEKHFGWKTFRVLTVTTDQHRMQSMMEALRKLHIPHSPGAPLFFFTTREELRASDPLAHDWRDGNDRAVRLILAGEARALKIASFPVAAKQCCSAVNDAMCGRLSRSLKSRRLCSVVLPDGCFVGENSWWTSRSA